MKSILERTDKNLDKLEKLDIVYLVAIWARAGVREFRYSGKVDFRGRPLVYQYDDLNGTRDCYVLRPITYTTSARIVCWTFDKSTAEFIANAVNVYRDEQEKQSQQEDFNKAVEDLINYLSFDD